MAANILAAAGLELNHCDKHVNAQDRLAVIASPALAGHSSVAPEATEHESEQLLGYRFSVVDRGADTLASKQHPVPPTRHVTIRDLQGTNTTGPRHLIKSRVKRISKRLIQSKCCFMTAVMQTEGLPTLCKKVSTVGRHESRLTTLCRSQSCSSLPFGQQSLPSPSCCLTRCCDPKSALCVTSPRKQVRLQLCSWSAHGIYSRLWTQLRAEACSQCTTLAVLTSVCLDCGQTPIYCRL